MSLLARLTKPKTPHDRWQPADQVYPSLFDIKTHAAALNGKGGVYALWHLGVRPQWLRIGAGPNLLDCLNGAAAGLADTTLRGNGGIYVAWAFVDAARRPGIVQYRRNRLEPVLQHVVLTGYTL